MKTLKNLFMLGLTLILVVGLAGCLQGNSEAQATAYEVYVTNEAGDPVEGARIQFCSDTECFVGETDKDGIAVFEQKAGTYTVHVLKSPQGYAKDATEYEAPAKPGRITITLKEETE